MAKINKIREIPKHYDLLGKEILEKSFVVAELSIYRKLELCVVDKINPKMIKLRTIKTNSHGHYFKGNKYPSQMMVVDNEDDVTMYILRNAGNV